MIIDLTTPQTNAIELKFSRFPDGQPHCSLNAERVREGQAEGLELIAPLRQVDDLMNICLAANALRPLSPDRARVRFTIPYLLSARMDRPIGPGAPHTLAVFASILNQALEGMGVQILDPHSPVSLELIHGATALHPDRLVEFALGEIDRETGHAAVVGVPDRGAILRTTRILERLHSTHDRVHCSKKRDPQTGELSGFQLDSGDVRGRAVLLVDDLCDGGGTFSGLAALLREAGATSVQLCVTHGLFSRGIEIPGIDRVFCSDSCGLPATFGFATSREADVIRYLRGDRVVLTVLTNFVRKLL